MSDRVPLAVWFGFVAMCVGLFMAILDVQIVATAMPTIQNALGIPPDWMSWIQTAYLIAEVVAIPLSGLLTRIFSLRLLFVLSIAVFTLASIGCALSGGFAALIAFRVVQGFAAGIIIPTVFSAALMFFPFRLQGLSATIAGMVAVLAPTVGPIIGGWVTEAMSWHWLFLLNVVPGLVTGLATLRLLPREKTEYRLARRIDLASLILLSIALAAVEIGLKEAPHRGWLSGLVVGLFALALSATVAFALRSLRREVPLVQLDLLANRDFALGCVLSFLTGVGVFGSVYLMPVFLAFVRDMGPIAIGNIMIVMGVAQLLVAPIVVALERRADARWIAAFGLVIFAIGCWMSTSQTRESGYDDMFWPQILRGAAMLFSILPVIRLSVGHLPPARVPDASGLFNMQRNLGGAIGIALIDTVIYSRAPDYGREIAARLQAGDATAAAEVGLPTAAFIGRPMPEASEAVKELIRPLIEKAALVHATNDAWMLVALIVASGLLLIPFFRKPGTPMATGGH